jgi:hypothetical protein
MATADHLAGGQNTIEICGQLEIPLHYDTAGGNYSERRRMDWSAIVGVVIGGAIALGSQWLVAARAEKHESRQAIREYRKARMQPVLDALDRAAKRWTWEEHQELADAIRYEGTGMSTDPEESAKRRREYKERLIHDLKNDISTTLRIPDKEVRLYVTGALWENINDFSAAYPRTDASKYDLREAYRRVEAWIFER